MASCDCAPSHSGNFIHHELLSGKLQQFQFLMRKRFAICFEQKSINFLSRNILALQLVVVVDEVYTDHSHIAGKFTILSSSKVYVGGSVNPRALLGARVHNNFVGCLRKVEFSADTLRLNLIDLARTGSKLIAVVGRVDYNCPSGDPQDPVTFTTRDSHLVLPPWEVSKQGVISFKFRTNEPNGLIILSTGTRPPRVRLSTEIENSVTA